MAAPPKRKNIRDRRTAAQGQEIQEMIPKPTLHTLPIEMIVPNPKNRDVFEPSRIEQLTEIFTKAGQINPLLGRFIEDGKKFELFAGHSRLESGKLAGLKSMTVLAYVYDNESDILDAMLMDNFTNRPPSNYELARGMKTYWEDIYPDHFKRGLVTTTGKIETLSDKFYLSQSHVKKILRINDLIRPLQLLIHEDVLPFTKLITCNRFPADLQETLYENLVALINAEGADYVTGPVVLAEIAKLDPEPRQIKSERKNDNIDNENTVKSDDKVVVSNVTVANDIDTVGDDNNAVGNDNDIVDNSDNKRNDQPQTETKVPQSGDSMRNSNEGELHNARKDQMLLKAVNLMQEILDEPEFSAPDQAKEELIRLRDKIDNIIASF